MLCVTTNSIDGKIVASYRGIVAAEVIFGANFARDYVAGITDVIGGRSGTYEKEFEGARKVALDSLIRKAEALHADAILALHFEYLVMGEKNGMIMVAASGTAVQLTKSDEERAKDAEHALEDKAVYFVMIGSSEKGPFSILQLRELIAAGRIEESTTVRVDGKDDARALGDLIRNMTSR
jgi:uncharacterized protein YbjQ (UPF0145 family)